MAEPSIYWWYLRAFTVARSGGVLDDKKYYTADGGDYESLEFMAAMAFAALDAGASRLRLEAVFLADLRSFLPAKKEPPAA